MPSNSWLRSEIVLLAALVFSQIVGSVNTVNAAEPTSVSFRAAFNGLRLTDQNGKAFAPKWGGHLTVVNFIYTGCSTACPIQTHELAEVQKALPTAVRQRVRLLSISIDPLQDTPSALRDYALRMGVDLTDWTFVTGRPEDIEKLASTLALFKKTEAPQRPEDHATWLWLVDQQGVVRQRYAGNPPDKARLVRELQTLQQLLEQAPQDAPKRSIRH